MGLRQGTWRLLRNSISVEFSVAFGFLFSKISLGEINKWCLLFDKNGKHGSGLKTLWTWVQKRWCWLKGCIDGRFQLGSSHSCLIRFYLRFQNFVRILLETLFLAHLRVQISFRVLLYNHSHNHFFFKLKVSRSHISIFFARIWKAREERTQ